MTLRVMVPLDGSAFAEQAIPHAIEIVSRGAGALHLVKVHQPAAEPAMGDGMYLSVESLDEEIREQDRDYLARVAAKIDPSYARVTTLLTGDIVAALDEYVEATGIDVIVMSTHGRGGLSRALLGSVAEALLKLTHVPTLLIRPHDHEDARAAGDAPLRKILIPVDPSAFSENVIPAALAIGDRERTHYTLLNVVIPPPPVALANGVVVPAAPQLVSIEEMARIATDHVQKVAERLASLRYNVKAAAVVGFEPAEAIRVYAAEHGFDLIAMTTHGRSGWKRLLLGSVADRVKRGTDIPLLVVQPLG